jgi:hypothetical protein
LFSASNAGSTGISCRSYFCQNPFESHFAVTAQANLFEGTNTNPQID